MTLCQRGARPPDVDQKMSQSGDTMSARSPTPDVDQKMSQSGDTMSARSPTSGRGSEDVAVW